MSDLVPSWSSGPAQRRRTWVPSPRETNVLLAVGFLALGYAFWMRYFVIQNTQVGLFCEAGAQTTLCLMRRFIVQANMLGAFGYVAVAAALLNLLRPHVVLFAIGLVAAALGVVMYDRMLAGIAVGLLILSFARPAVAED